MRSRDSSHARRLGEKRIHELAKYPPRGTPDNVLAIGNEDDGPPNALSLPLLHAKGVWPEEMRQWNFDHALDLAAIGLEGRRTHGEAQDRRDHEVRAGCEHVVEET